MPPIYLDYNATTPLDPRVFEAMRPYFLESFGNAGSRTHIYGQRAKDAVELARDETASLLQAAADELIFTSGATESNNIALLGLAAFGESSGRQHILASAVEHKSVLEPLDRLSALGFTVELLPVTSGGYVEPEAVRDRVRSDTLVVSIMHANNETGVLNPVREIAELLEETEVFFHVDAAQTFGKEVEQLKDLSCELLSISGHKIFGPQGIGGLLVRRRSGRARSIRPIFAGGGQERGLRPGTLAVPLIVGLGTAARLAAAEFGIRRNEAARVKAQLLSDLDGIEFDVNGATERTMAHVLNLSFRGVDSEALMLKLRDEIACSNGAACTTTSYATSHVLEAMGLDEDRISSSIRLSWGQGISKIPADPLISAVQTLLA